MSVENVDIARFDQLEQTLEALQENARQLALIAEDFQPKSQDVLNQKLQTLICGMQELDEGKQAFQNVRVPTEVLDYLDKGKNPHLYTKECMERTFVKNQQVKGKMELYKKFRAHLLKELHEEMPHETMTYRCFREQGPPGGQPRPESSVSPQKMSSPPPTPTTPDS